MDRPKSAAGERTVPLTPSLVQELRTWKLSCPQKDGRLALVFPSGIGNVESHGNLVQRQLRPVEVPAGVTAPVLDAQGVPNRDADGRPLVPAKYKGLHAFRHFFVPGASTASSTAGSSRRPGRNPASAMPRSMRSVMRLVAPATSAQPQAKRPQVMTIRDNHVRAPTRARIKLLVTLLTAIGAP
jgi:hypothetical protein